jgi:L-threonylcarbamoyladenylate synthase
LTARLGPRPAGAPHEALADDAAGFARELYAALYRLERAAPEALYIEAPPSDPVEAWRAVRDRLARATA